MVLELMQVATLALTSVSPRGTFFAQQAVPGDFMIKLERTSCFGECPVYLVTIDAKGNVVYEGQKFVRVTDRQIDRIPVARVAALLETVGRIRFFDLQDKYRAQVTDNPTTFVTVTLNGRAKRIEDYVIAPKELKEFEKQIDEMARTKRWILLDEATLQQLVRDGWVPSAEERAELLRKAILADDVAVIKGLIENGADPNGVYNQTNTTPLMMIRSAAAARALLEAGAILSTRNQYGLTPLGRATFLAPDVTEVLLKAGAEPEAPDADGQMPLSKAACIGNAGVVKLLLQAGADPDRHFAGIAPLECARMGREQSRARQELPIEGSRPFVADFDGVITQLEQALAKRPRK